MSEPTDEKRLDLTEALSSSPALGELSSSRQPCLVLLTGPEKGALFRLQRGSHVIGRSGAQADIVLDGRGVSRAHARVDVLPDGTLKAVDLGSTNGIFVNGSRVEAQPLEDGDSLALGPEIVLRVEFRDSQVQKLMADMYQNANQDPLTGLLNRRSFQQRLAEEHAAVRRHSYSSCVAMLDVDRFKSINDTYGHGAGDTILVYLARSLQEGVRQEDVVGRLGGEEFVVLVRQSPVEGSRVLLERLREKVASSDVKVVTPSGEQTIRFTFSAGIVSLKGCESPEEALELADRALYQAKESGRNRVQAVPEE
ncbi:MAG: GGDEF domain-containing protein [Armatimonadetes bacterium]|nr:GGDEF domain-containing protein [Armatimonadota bacterium]